MHQSHTIHLATWARLLVLSLLLGVGVLVGSLLSTSTAHAQPLNTVTITDCTDGYPVAKRRQQRSHRGHHRLRL